MSASPLLDLPLIKENSADRLLAVIRIFHSSPLDREAQREGVLALYGDKDEQSVFRGMVIPSLRKLGIIQGFEDMLFLSGDGRLIAEAAGTSAEDGLRALRAVLLERDRSLLGLTEKRLRKPAKLDSIYRQLGKLVAAPSLKQALERIERWVLMLRSCGLLVRNPDETISPDGGRVKVAARDLITARKSKQFPKVLFAGYQSIVAKQRGVEVVDIAELRSEAAAIFWHKHQELLTERQFDELLRAMPRVSESYLISFGKPMGPEEKLFEFNGQHYRTMSVRVFSGRNA